MARFESLRGLQGLDGACGSFGPVETERLATAASLAAAVWQKKRNHLGLASNGLKGLKGLKRLEGASGSFGPVEKERLGWPQPRVVHQKRNHLACHSLKFGSSKPVWQVWKGLRGLQGLDGACGSFGPAETERLGLPQL